MEVPLMCDRELLAVTDGSLQLERREMLRLSMAGLAGLCLGLPVTAAADGAPSLDWARLLDRLGDDARDLMRRDSPEVESVYLDRLAERLGDLGHDPGDRPGRRPTAERNGVRFELLHQERPLLALRFRMQPGAELPLHDHRAQNGVMKVLDGDVTLRTYEPVEANSEGAEPRSDGGFVVRSTGERRLATDGVAMLGRRRDNIHG
ncbi:MAG: hypothetical protein AAGE94_14310, partial [Acidobacteriota bacterium]